MKGMTRVLAILVIATVMAILGSVSFATTVGTTSLTSTTTNTTNEIISQETKSKLVNIKASELKSIEDYTTAYGSNVYGMVAYILNKVRIYSIPLAFVAIAISSIYQYVVGIRHLENRDKGLNSMITVVTLFIICQILPLLFAIIVKGWRS